MRKINWNPSNKELAKFGLTILIGFGFIGLIVFFKANQPTIAMSICLGAAFICVISVVLPAAAKPFYFIWMAIGLVIGAVMSRLILTLIFYGILTPVALFFKLKGRDALNRHKKKNVSSYWNEHPSIDDKTYYDHLF